MAHTKQDSSSPFWLTAQTPNGEPVCLYDDPAYPFPHIKTN